MKIPRKSALVCGIWQLGAQISGTRPITHSLYYPYRAFSGGSGQHNSICKEEMQKRASRCVNLAQARRRVQLSHVACQQPLHPKMGFLSFSDPTLYHLNKELYRTLQALFDRLGATTGGPFRCLG
jgi:hypothetical protein